MALDTKALLILVLSAVAQNAGYHAERWVKHDPAKLEEQWLEILENEVQELREAIAGVHEHPAPLELIQIASICTTWLVAIEAKTPGTTLAALEQTLREHKARRAQGEAHE